MCRMLFRYGQWFPFAYTFTITFCPFCIIIFIDRQCASMCLRAHHSFHCHLSATQITDTLNAESQSIFIVFRTHSNVNRRMECNIKEWKNGGAAGTVTRFDQTPKMENDFGDSGKQRHFDVVFFFLFSLYRLYRRTPYLLFTDWMASNGVTVRVYLFRIRSIFPLFRVKSHPTEILWTSSLVETLGMDAYRQFGTDSLSACPSRKKNTQTCNVCVLSKSRQPDTKCYNVDSAIRYLSRYI